MPEPKASSRRRTAKAGRGGRPRTADLEKLNENILAAAGELFLAQGFDGTSMDAIAEKARISKRTLYSRHADKSALFNTVIYDLLDRILVPVERIQYEPGDLSAALLAAARDMVSGVMRPGFSAVYRVVVFEAQRRPEFGRWINDAKRRPALQAIAGILQRHRDELRITDFERAAEQFISLTVDFSIQFGAFGMKTTLKEMEDRLKAAVDLFLNGARHRDGANEGRSRRGKAVAAKK
jgi:TetR/AcrR family transcriptional regulator, mexJK operon transcriptional repressor